MESLVKLLIFFSVSALGETSNIMKVGMGSFQPIMGEVRICTSFVLDDNITYHFTKFQPKPGKRVNHIILVGCEEPATDKQYWNCGALDYEDPNFLHPSSPYCKDNMNYWIYGWDKRQDATSFSVPDGFSFQVGRNTKFSYLVMQTHYAELESNKDYEDTKADVYLTYENKPVSTKQLGMTGIQIHDQHVISAKTSRTTEMIADSPVDLHPLMFNVHVHGIGTKVSGYAIERQRLDSKDPVWIKIGERSLPAPMYFFPVENNVTIQKGDTIAVRCTYYNYRDHDVHFGQTDEDEMCEFRILYWTETRSETAPFVMESEDVSWEDIGLKNIPEDA